MSSAATVVVPLKSFDGAKSRLAPALDEHQRRRLVITVAERIVRAARSLPIVVVHEDDRVAEWAEALGATAISRPGRGLNGSVQDVVASLRAEGVGRVVIAHGDLPLATDLEPVATMTSGVVIVPDRHDEGTNVLAVDAGAGFRFAYGPGSFRRHVAEAGRIGQVVEVVRDARLGWDLDVPDDLDHPGLSHS